MGVFGRMMAGLAAGRAEPKTVMIDATYLKAHRTASSLRVKKGDLGRLIGRTKGGMNTKLHAITDAQWSALELLHHRRPDQRLTGCGKRASPWPAVPSLRGSGARISLIRG